jgi:undecaprenyl-diphosphatase
MMGLRDRFARLTPSGYLSVHLAVGFVLAAASGLVFGLMVDEVFDDRDAFAPDAAAQRVAARLATPWLTAAVRELTKVGNFESLLLLSLGVAAYLAYAHSRRRLVAFASTMIGGSLLNVLLKAYFHRARPPAELALAFADGYSFPSGHAMGSMLFFGSLAYVLFFSLERHRVWRIIGVVASLVMAPLIGGTRIYLGVHYLSDVLAGFAGGLLWLCICVSGTEAWVRWRDRREAG